MNLPSFRFHVPVEDPHDVPVGLVLVDELLVQGSDLVGVVGGLGVEDHVQSHVVVAVVDGAVEVGVERADGETVAEVAQGLKLVDKPGYDKESGLFFQLPQGQEIVPINLRPDTGQVDECWGLLDQLIEDVAFESDLDRANGLLAIITAVCRPAVQEAPLFIISSAVKGDGKSTFGKMLTLLCNNNCCMVPADKNVEGQEKRIEQQLIEGSLAIFLDDAYSPVGGNTLAGLLTSSGTKIRVFGSNEDSREIKGRIFMVATGLNLVPDEQCLSRSRIIRINTNLEDPARRKFKKRNILKFVELNRQKIVSAAITIFLDYNNKPEAYKEAVRQKTKRGSCRMHEFADLFDCVLIDRMDIDPSCAADNAREMDEETNNKLLVLEALNKAFQGEKFFASDVSQILSCKITFTSRSQEDEQLVRDALEQAIPGKHTSQKVGMYFRKIREQPVQGLKLVYLSHDRARGNPWQVVKHQN